MKKLRDLLGASSLGPWQIQMNKHTWNYELYSDDSIASVAMGDDAAFIAAFQNCAEELLAVVEASNKVARHLTEFPSLTRNHYTHHGLIEALAALERKVESL